MVSMPVLSKLVIQDSNVDLAHQFDAISWRYEKIWHKFIWKQITDVYSGTLHSLSNELTKLAQINVCITFKINEQSSSPCGTISVMSKMEETTTWIMSVNKIFMINITIEKAYVKYTDHCDPDYVAMFEGNTVANAKRLGYFCGHVLYESVYTKNNIGMLYVQTTVYNHVHITSISSHLL